MVARRRANGTAYHGEDIIFKSVSQLLGNELVAAYGLTPCKITGPGPTEVTLVPASRRLDTVFDVDDGTFLHLEFQSRQTKLARFAVYDAMLYERVQRKIRTVVFYTGGVEQAADGIQVGCLTYQVENIFMDHFDGEAARAAVENKLVLGEALEPKEVLDLIFSPLMRRKGSPGQGVLAALEVGSRIPDEDLKDFCLANILGLGEKFLSRGQLEKALEVLGMTRIANMIGERFLEKGRMEGRAEDVLLLLRQRFGDVPATVLEAVKSQDEDEALTRLLLVAATAGSLAEFEASLGRVGAH